MRIGDWAGTLMRMFAPVFSAQQSRLIAQPRTSVDRGFVSSGDLGCLVKRAAACVRSLRAMPFSARSPRREPSVADGRGRRWVNFLHLEQLDHPARLLPKALHLALRIHRV